MKKYTRTTLLALVLLFSIQISQLVATPVSKEIVTKPSVSIMADPGHGNPY